MQNGEKEVGEEKQCQYGSKAAEQVPALLFVESDTFHTQCFVFGSRFGQVIEDIAQSCQQGQCYRTDQCRHPELTDVQGVDNEKSDGFGCAATDCDTESEKGSEQIGNPASFEEAEDDSPHTAKRQSVEEQRQHIERAGQASEKNQREFGH